MSDSTAGGAPAWPLVPSFPPDLFKGLAEYYARYRPAYPPALLGDLVARAGVSGSGRLLDLACGTGELALALRFHFAEVWAVDLEPDMVEMGRCKADEIGANNVRWSVGRVEDVDAEPASFELITAGNAFHRLDRPLVTSRVLNWLQPGRCFAVAGSSSVWSGTADWQVVACEVIQKWTGHEGRMGQPKTAQSSDAPRQTHEGVLLKGGFQNVTQYQFPPPYRWTLDEFVGYLHSTSVFSRASQEDVGEEFETELRKRLLAYSPNGQLEEIIDFYYILARRPPDV